MKQIYIIKSWLVNSTIFVPLKKKKKKLKSEWNPDDALVLPLMITSILPFHIVTFLHIFCGLPKIPNTTNVQCLFYLDYILNNSF